MANRTNLDRFINDEFTTQTLDKENTSTAEFPKEWETIEIGKIAEECQSGFACSKKYVEENGIPHLRPNNIGYYGKLDLTQLVFLPPEMVDLTKYSLRAGDVLFNNTNSKELVGRASLVREDLQCGFSNHITRLRTRNRLVTSEWLVYSINYLWSKGYFLRLSKKWIGQAGINNSMLRCVKIPLPPIDMQKRIVSRIDGILPKIEDIKKIQEESLSDIEKMTLAVLRMAFSGKL